MSRFILQGSIYYTQTRKCGKANCGTCSRGPKTGHGPYWYRRDRITGKVHYIGRKLPDRIATVRAARRRLRPEALDQRSKLAAQQQVLESFTSSAALSPDDIRQLTDMGFEDGIL
jgi:hypothetical protein